MKYVIVPMPPEAVILTADERTRILRERITDVAEAWAFVEENYVRGYISVTDRETSLKYLKEYLEEDSSNFPFDSEGFVDSVSDLFQKPKKPGLVRHIGNWIRGVTSLRLSKQD